MAHRAKHRAYVARKHARWAARSAAARARAQYSKARGYTYDRSRYAVAGGAEGTILQPATSTFPVDHLWFPTLLPHAEREPAPRRLYLLWTGDNPLTSNRRRSVDVVREENPDLSVELVTPENLADYVVDGHPLPTTYEHLSPVHRSDYLRAYLMYHHGGVYLDIKPYRGRASAYLDVLDTDPTVWAVGSAEVPGNWSPALRGRLSADLTTHAGKVLNQASFAFRPHTELAAAWLAEMERRLRYFADVLSTHPAIDAMGTYGEYPVPWFALHSASLSPLALKHHDRVRIMDSLELSLGGFETYR